MKAQIITRDGQPAYAVIPYKEYRRLLADAKMLADVRDFDAARQALAAGDEEAISSKVVDRLLDGEHPVRVWREYRGISAAELAGSKHRGAGDSTQKGSAVCLSPLF